MNDTTDWGELLESAAAMAKVIPTDDELASVIWDYWWENHRNVPFEALAEIQKQASGLCVREVARVINREFHKYE